jgi:hypothetical protein
MELVEPIVVRIAIRLNQQFRHSDRGRNRRMAGFFDPGEDEIG